MKARLMHLSRLELSNSQRSAARLWWRAGGASVGFPLFANMRGMERRSTHPLGSVGASFRRCRAFRRSIAAFSVRRRAALCTSPGVAQAWSPRLTCQPAPGRGPYCPRAEPRRRPGASLRGQRAGTAPATTFAAATEASPLPLAGEGGRSERSEDRPGEGALAICEEALSRPRFARAPSPASGRGESGARGAGARRTDRPVTSAATSGRAVPSGRHRQCRGNRQASG